MTATTLPPDPWVPGLGGTLTVGIDQAPTGCNPNSATGDTWADHLVLEPVLPSAFVVGPGDSATYDSAVIEQAEVVSTTPQTVVYTINPRAEWSDGVHITAADFLYAWHEQRGAPTGAATPTGLQSADVASTAGYRDIRSVKGSNHGRTVTVVFRTPFADWKMLFDNLLPAHVMEKVGWSPGCRTLDPRIDLSGGPYEIGKVVAGREVVLVRNPHWWGQAPYLDRIVVRIGAGEPQLSHWLTTGKAQVVLPTAFTRTFLEQVAGRPSLDSAVTISSTFLQLEYSTTSPVTASVAVREALSHAVDRQALVDQVVGWADTGIVPSASHLYSQTQGSYPGPRTPSIQAAGQPGTTTTTAPPTPTPSRPFPLTADPAETAKLLDGAGYVQDAAKQWLPPNGKPLVVRVAVDAGDRWAVETATVLARQLAAEGIGITRTTAPDARTAGEDLATGSADAALLPFTATPYPSEAIAWYTPLLGTPGHEGSEDWSNLDDPTLNTLLTKASEQLNPVSAGPLYAQADAMLWQQMVALPLFSQPTVLAWSAFTSGIGPNPTGPGLLWYPQTWSLRVPPTSPDTLPSP